ncbi:MAG TPA: hypothetical protein PKX47_00850 [Smithellaceae bacterium]|jgi:hypothetical protein|nr:hypothetical protein [Smithellaceae bacterium]HNY96640.1 hypothetical protein [Smithellaceae bacterium]HOD63121.1 hypothetical protein [Smithellaceae bacterium]HOE22559.1 hypothetical protein [Smithellaceae bacterium]HOH57216.1 hypothetical protein [Smithellaceae bacterium]
MSKAVKNSGIDVKEIKIRKPMLTMRLNIENPFAFGYFPVRMARSIDRRSKPVNHIPSQGQKPDLRAQILVPAEKNDPAFHKPLPETAKS